MVLNKTTVKKASKNKLVQTGNHYTNRIFKQSNSKNYYLTTNPAQS